MIQKISSGDPLRADDINEIIDAVNGLLEGSEKMRVRAGPGLRMDGNVISLADLTKGSGSGNADSSLDADHPFQVSLQIIEPKTQESGDDSADASAEDAEEPSPAVRVLVAGGCWFGNGSSCNGIGGSATALTPDFWEIPDCEAETPVAEGDEFCIVLYAPAREGIVAEAPWLYLVKTPAEELFKKIRERAYSTAVVVGAWKVRRQEKDSDDAADDDAGTTDSDAAADAQPPLTLVDAPGQILRMHHRHVNPQTFSTGAFGWSRCDGAKNTFRVRDGFVLVRPNAAVAGTRIGDIFALADKTRSELVTFTPSTLSYGISTIYPEEEIKFLRSVALKPDPNGSTSTVDVDVPTYTAEASTKTASFAVATASGTSTVKAVSTVALNKSGAVTTVYAKPDGQLVEFPGILTNALDLTTSLASVPVPQIGSSTISITYADGVTVKQSGTVKASVKIPTGQTVETTLVEDFNPLVGVSLTSTINQGEEQSEIITTRELLPLDGGEGGEDASTVASLKSMLLEQGESGGGVNLAPIFASVGGGYFSFSDSQADGGAVVWLCCAVEDGNVSAEWKVCDATGTPQVGETPQAISISVEAKNVGTGGTTVGGAEAPRAYGFGVVAKIDASKAGRFAATFPMAFISRDDLGNCVVQPLVNGVLTWAPTLAVALNSEEDVAHEDGLAGPAPGANSELLDAEKLIQVGAETEENEGAPGNESAQSQTARAAAAALAVMAAGAPPIFDYESADVAEALEYVVNNE